MSNVDLWAALGVGCLERGPVIEMKANKRPDPKDAATVRPRRNTRRGVLIDERVTSPPNSGFNLLSLARSAPPSGSAAPASGVFLGSIVRSDQLSVVFQPIVSFDTGKVFACEALVRCSVPAYANPETLFAEAVTTGCAGRLGRMIREVATSICRDLPVFLNVHPVELHEPWLIRPDDAIYTHTTDVYLEITESVPFQHFDICNSVLREIRWRGGVHLVVDDLGAGFSNLKRISDLEPKIVKLDRELIRGLPANLRQQRLVSSVVKLCIEMEASVVAEGVETVDEFLAVRDTGVHYGQGYLFARPTFPIPEVIMPPGTR